MNIQFDLPSPGSAAQPAFVNRGACDEWLDALPVSNPATAQAQLRVQLGLLAVAGLKPTTLFEILEQLRGPVLQVQAEMTRKFAFRPLPLADFEAGALAGSLDLWRSFGHGWQVCVQAVVEGDRELKGHGAQICQRALDTQARLILDMLNAGHDLAGMHWLLLHKLYRAAEQVGVTTTKVKDQHLKELGATNCVAAYARPLLLALGAPGDWEAKQAQRIARWTEHLATKVTISSDPPATTTKPPVLVDLAAGRGGFRLAAPATPAGGKDLRYLDIGEFSLSIKNRIIRLRKGQAPASMGLGDDSNPPATERLLMTLYKHWGDGRAGREQVRRPVSGRSLVACGVPAMHYYISGKAFRQPGLPTELSSRQRQEIATFGRVATRDDDDHSLIQGFSLEDWAMHDESVAGLRLVRASGATGSRFSAGQLIAVRPFDARAFMVGMVRWAQVQTGGELMVGVKSMPGVPMAMAIKAAGVNARAEKYQQGLLLPAVPALQSTESVLLPSGWFKPGCVLEMHADLHRMIRLDALVGRGTDFDRCTFSAA